MSNSGIRAGLEERVRIWVHALTYAIVVAIFGTIVAFVLGIVTGGGAVRAKQLLFVFGWIVMAYATVRLWPSSPEDLEDPAETTQSGNSLPEEHDTSRFQTIVQSIPPSIWVRSPKPHQRMTIPGKLFLASLLMLLISLLLEVTVGIE